MLEKQATMAKAQKRIITNSLSLSHEEERERKTDTILRKCENVK